LSFLELSFQPIHAIPQLLRGFAVRLGEATRGDQGDEGQKKSTTHQNDGADGRIEGKFDGLEDSLLAVTNSFGE
jgi:hypothetical protein